MDKIKENRKIKITIIGDKDVGKTSILNAYLDRNVYNPATTIGIDFFTQSIAIEDQRCSVTLWDTAGAERFQALTQTYLRDSDIIIVVYDLAKKTSNIGFWMRQVEQNRCGIVGILGNKTDLTRLNTEHLPDILFPWTRQNWKIVMGKCSSRKSTSVKTFFRRCLKEIVKTDLEEPFEMPSVTFVGKKHENRTCCT
jgi:small GTP-binding protein